MPHPRRPLTTKASIAVIMAVVASLAGCSRSYDTTQIDAVSKQPKRSASTTSIVVETLPPSTTIDYQTQQMTPASFTDIQSTLSQLVSSFAADPQLLGQLKALSNGDLASIARMFNIDPAALDQLGMTVGQIEALGDSVNRSGTQLLQQLSSTRGGSPIDPGVLIGLLTRSVDLNGITKGAVAAIIQMLSNSLAKVQVQITPEITIYLDQLLKEIDPNGLGQVSADPQNASFIALITSVILSANPLLAEQLLQNPLLDPKLKDLLLSLQDLNANLGETASAAILAALKALFPGLGE